MLESDRRYRVQSVERALGVLETLADAGSDGMTVSELARTTGASKSTVFTLLQTLLAHGFVADSGAGPSRRYRLGMSLARLGDRVLSEITARDVAMPVLQSLTETTGLTSRVAVLDDAYAVVVGRVDAPGTVRFAAYLGRREFPHCTAVGKALLSTLPETRVRAIAKQTGLPRRTSHSVTDLDALLQDLALVTERGYAIDDEEDTEGVFCVGSSVFDHAGRSAAAISVTGLKLDLPAWRVHKLGETVREHAARISSLLGASAR